MQQVRRSGCKAVFGHHCVYYVRPRKRQNVWSVLTRPASSIAHRVFAEIDRHGADGICGDGGLGAFVRQMESFFDNLERQR